MNIKAEQSRQTKLQFEIKYLPQAFSSEPSLQSALPSQNNSLLIQIASPQANLLGSHSGSSVFSSGAAFFSLVILSQLVTAHFQSQVCFSRSKARPGGHLICCRPCGDGEVLVSSSSRTSTSKRKFIFSQCWIFSKNGIDKVGLGQKPQS